MFSTAWMSLQRPYTRMPVLRVPTLAPTSMLVPPRSRSIASWLAAAVLLIWLFLPSMATVSLSSTSLQDHVDKAKRMMVQAQHALNLRLRSPWHAACFSPLAHLGLDDFSSTSWSKVSRIWRPLDVSWADTTRGGESFEQKPSHSWLIVAPVVGSHEKDRHWRLPTRHSSPDIMQLQSWAERRGCVYQLVTRPACML